MLEIKCQQCKEPLSAQEGICPACGFINSLEGELSLDHLSDEIGSSIAAIKSINPSKATFTFTRNRSVILILLTVTVFVLSTKTTWWLLIPGFFFFLVSIISVFRKPPNHLKDYPSLKATAEELIRKYESIYGADNQAKKQIIKFRKEIDGFDQRIVILKRKEWILHGVALFLLMVVFLLPASLSQSMIKKQALLEEVPYILKVEELLKGNQINEAKQLVLEVKTPESITQIKSMIQFKELENELLLVETIIDEEKYDDAAAKLRLVRWLKQSSSYQELLIEENYYKQFIRQKTAINNLLPVKYRIQIESEYDLLL